MVTYPARHAKARGTALCAATLLVIDRATAQDTASTLAALDLPAVNAYPIDTPCADALEADKRCVGDEHYACQEGLICFQISRGYGSCEPPEWLDSDEAAEKMIIAASAGCGGAVVDAMAEAPMEELVEAPMVAAGALMDEPGPMPATAEMPAASVTPAAARTARFLLPRMLGRMPEDFPEKIRAATAAVAGVAEVPAPMMAAPMMAPTATDPIAAIDAEAPDDDDDATAYPPLSPIDGTSVNDLPAVGPPPEELTDEDEIEPPVEAPLDLEAGDAEYVEDAEAPEMYEDVDDVAVDVTGDAATFAFPAGECPRDGTPDLPVGQAPNGLNVPAKAGNEYGDGVDEIQLEYGKIEPGGEYCATDGSDTITVGGTLLFQDGGECALPPTKDDGSPCCTMKAWQPNSGGFYYDNCSMQMDIGGDGVWWFQTEMPGDESEVGWGADNAPHIHYQIECNDCADAGDFKFFSKFYPEEVCELDACGGPGPDHQAEEVSPGVYVYHLVME